MRKLFPVAAAVGLFLASSPSQAWFDGGHMVVAYIGYQNLTPQTRTRVDRLLMLNKMYLTWTKGATKKQVSLVAFLRAATWPDCIKEAKCSPAIPVTAGTPLPATQPMRRISVTQTR
jgi:hypothetical protein